MTMVEISPDLEDIIDAVRTRTNGRYDDTLIRALVTHAVDELNDAPVRDYIEVLVIKEVIDELRHPKAPSAAV
jgi:hypothetical protein